MAAALATPPKSISPIWLPFTLIAILNGAIIAPLFFCDYLNNFASNEGTFITIAKFLSENARHPGWFPLWNAGMPLEFAYSPFLPFLNALLASVAGISHARAFHLIAAASYSFGPAFAFLLARALSRRTAPSLAAAVLFSLFSFSHFVPEIHRDLPSLWASRRLQSIVVYGETPHNVALALLPLPLLCLHRFLTTGFARFYAAAAFLTAAVMLTNAFGAIDIGFAALLFALLLRESRLSLRLAGLTLPAVGWLLSCRFLTPSLLQVTRINSQMSGGDFRPTAASVAVLTLGAAAFFVLIFLARSRFSASFLFFLFFGTTFYAMCLLWSLWKIPIIPQPFRYSLEWELGISTAACLGLGSIAKKLPSSLIRIAAIPLVAISAWATVRNAQYGWSNIRLVPDIKATQPYQVSTWISRHVPGRVMVSGDTEFVFSLFASNPQLSGGHTQFAPNHFPEIAVYTIYTGIGTGNADGEISALWLKAYGCSAITVPGPHSSETYHPIRNPEKFKGLLPVLWEDDDLYVYGVPGSSGSIVHVIPREAEVRHPPYNGLDVTELRRYVRGIESLSARPVAVSWSNPSDAWIEAVLQPNEEISVQTTWDNGWEASANGAPSKVRADGLNSIILEPPASGACRIHLTYTGGTARRVESGVSMFAALALFAFALRRKTVGS